jgi:4-amino-4-deoxy-L-arabinose transferase-like glycosyltransferase
MILSAKPETSNNYIYHLLFIVILIGFVVFKWSHLLFPYCWDEAEFYGPAVKLMYERGISLSPQALPVEYSRGHPLLFHVLGAYWMKILGPSLMSSHLFALSVSLILLVSIYLFCLKIFSEKIALTAVLIIIIQPIFLVQSELVLPEVLLSLFMITALFSYILGYSVLYWFAAACAIMTKETAITLFCSIALYQLILFVRDREKNYVLLVKKWCFIMSPLFVWFLFLLWQKAVLGWFFFPDHTGYIDFTPVVLWEKFTEILLVVFVWNGRNVMSLICLILLIIVFIRKSKGTFEKSNPYFLLFGIFIFCFALVSSVNFFTNRYIISLIFLFAIMTAYTIHAVIKNGVAALTIVSLVLISAIFNCTAHRTDCDHNFGYIDAARAKMEAQRAKELLTPQDKPEF